MMDRTFNKISMYIIILVIFLFYIILLFFNTKYKPNGLYRGFMLDTSRQFFNVDITKSIIRQLYMYNYTHLHLSISNNERFSYLSDFDNGRLATVNNNTKYHTKNDLLEIVNYANYLGIIVIPEFEFSGHVRVWKYVYPDIMSDDFDDEFNLRNNKVYYLLTSMFSEIIPIFYNSNLLHLSHDEMSQPNSEIIKSLDFAKSIANRYYKYGIIWDDPIYENGIDVSKDFIIQNWHNNMTNELISNEYYTIISEMDYWYIGGSKDVLDYDIKKINKLYKKNIYGFELVWFTNETIDDPNDIGFVYEEIKKASRVMNSYYDL